MPGDRRARVFGPRFILCAVGAILVAALAFADAAAAVTARADAGTTASLWPNDPRALTRQAEALIAGDPPRSPARAAALARRSLALAALQPRALRIVGTATEIGGDERDASRQILLAERLSRRDLLTQLWGIEHAVSRGEVAAVLRHYDIALRTEPDSEQLLFPVLAGALGEPAIRRGFRPYLGRQPVWLQPFLEYAADRGSDPQGLAMLLAAPARGTAARSDLISSKLLTRLLPGGDLASAIGFARSDPAYRPGLERDATLGPATMGPSLRPLTWAPQEGNGVFARADTAAATLHVFADPGAAGEVLQRFLALAPGRYVLATSHRFASAGDGATASWRISCLRDGHFVAQWTGRDPLAARRPRTQQEVVLPDGCDRQYVTLSVDGGTDTVPLDYELTSIALTRAR